MDRAGLRLTKSNLYQIAEYPIVDIKIRC